MARGGRIIIHSLTRVGTGISLYRPGDGPLTSTDHWVSNCSCSSAPSPGLKRPAYRVPPGFPNYPLAFQPSLLPTAPLVAFPLPLQSLPQGPEPEPLAGPSPGDPARLPLRPCPLVCLVSFPRAVTPLPPIPLQPAPPSPPRPDPPSHWCRYTAYGTGGVGGWVVGEAASSGWVSETDLPYCGVGNGSTIP